jgi:hypothetical protein
VDDQIVRTHPNDATALSAFWLQSSDADADRHQLARMRFDGGMPVHIPRISARGYCVPIGPTYILALEPDGPGISADALSKGGPQVLGSALLSRTWTGHNDGSNTDISSNSNARTGRWACRFSHPRKTISDCSSNFIYRTTEPRFVAAAILRSRTTYPQEGSG